MSIQIRRAVLEDAEEYRRILHEIDVTRSERVFLDEELHQDAESQVKDMEWYLSGENRTLLVAEDEGVLVGYATLLGGMYEVDRRTGSIVVEIVEAYRHRGIGRALLQGIEQFARESEMCRLELTVLGDNEVAIGLYEKLGFTREGVRRSARWIGGRLRDEFWMSKLL